MCIGDRVSWHVLGFGDRLDHHSYMFEGNNLKYDGRQVEYVTVFPGRAETVYMEPDNPGLYFSPVMLVLHRTMLFICSCMNIE